MSLYRTTARGKDGAYGYRGSWIVKRRILGLRVRQATGMYDWEQANELEQTLVKLGKHGRRDLIAAFMDEQVKGAELLAGVERYGVTFQLTVETAVKARRAAYEWLRDVKLAVKTRMEYRHGLGAVVGKLPPLTRAPTEAEERALSRGPAIGEVPRLLASYARHAKPVMFVQVRAAWQSCVRDTVHKGQHSELWHLIAAVRGPKREERDVLGGLTPERAREAAEKLAAAYGATDGQVWWMLCCTGMEPKECWRKDGWRAVDQRLEVRGTKTKSGYRVRWVPLVVTPVRPAVGIKAFRKRLKAVGEAMGLEKLTPYVARRTFAHFLELAKKHEGGPEDSQCDLLLGQSPKTDRAKYREHDIIPYLAGIGRAIRTVIGADPKYMRAMA